MKTINILKTLTVIALNVCVLSGKSQDLHFSQFMMTPLELDPSQAGKFQGDIRGIINYRDQWSSITSNPFRTYKASLDMHFNKGEKKDNFFGVGLITFSDKAGQIALNTTTVTLNIAYHLKVTKSSYLSGGIKAGIRQNSIDLSNLRFDSQFDGSGHNATLPSGETFSQTAYLSPDVSVGLSYCFVNNTTDQETSNNGYSRQKVNVGFAAHHVSSPVTSYIEGNSVRFYSKYIFYMLTSFGISGTNIAIQPSGFVQLQGGATNIVLSSYFRYTLKEQSEDAGVFNKGVALSIGMHYRLGDAIIPAVLIETGSLAFGISYDINLSGLSSVTNGKGGYEFSIRYINPNPFGTRQNQASFF